MKFKIDWIDSGREPKVAPNPNFPHGRDIDASHEGHKTCTVTLPYPAKRCGVYIIECDVCKLRTGVTTAGRPDDPRSVRMDCKEPLH